MKKNTKKSKLNTTVTYMVLIGITIVISAFIIQNSSENYMLDVYCKQNPYSYNGELTSYFDGRVYYVVRYGGMSQVYSMLDDGSDNRSEFKGEDIHNLVIMDDKCYYVKKNGEYNGKFPASSLFVRDNETNIEEEIVIEQELVGSSSVLSAYITGNETIIIENEENIASSDAPVVNNYIIGGRDEREVVNDIDYYENGGQATIFDDIVILTYPEGIEYYENWFMTWLWYSILDKNNGEFIITDEYTSGTCMSYIKDGSVYILLKNKLILADENTFKKEVSIEVESDSMYYLQKVYPCGREIYIHSINLNKNIDESKLYYIDIVNKEAMTLILFENNQRFVGLNNNVLVYIDDNKILFREVSYGDLGDIIFDYEFKKNTTKHSKVEMAGDWTFVYNEGNKKGHGVLYKINYKLGVVETVEYR